MQKGCLSWQKRLARSLATAVRGFASSDGPGVFGEADLNVDSPRVTAFCEELRTRGFAIVRCPESLTHREETLAWLQHCAHLAPAHCKSELTCSSSLAAAVRYEEVTWPRRMARIDIVPAIDFVAAGPVGLQSAVALGASLRRIATSCLTAVAHVERLPELCKLVASEEHPELLHEAKEPSLLRANLYPRSTDSVSVGMDPSFDQPRQRSTGPCWHIDLGLFTVTPMSSGSALMASPFHDAVGDCAFLEELLEPALDVIVFAGTSLCLATKGRYTAMVHGVSTSRSSCVGRISMPFFLRARRGAIIDGPQTVAQGTGTLEELLYPAVIEPEAVASLPNGALDLLRFHRDVYGTLCTRGQVVPLPQLVAACGAEREALHKRLSALRVPRPAEDKFGTVWSRCSLPPR